MSEYTEFFENNQREQSRKYYEYLSVVSITVDDNEILLYLIHERRKA